MGEKRELEASVECLVVDEKQSETDNNTKTLVNVSDVSGEVRRWFIQLTNEERMVALSFSDDLFLDALLSVGVSLSPSRGIVERLEGGAPAHTVVLSGVQWERMFMIKEFSKLYEAFKEKALVDVVEVASVDNKYPSVPVESNEAKLLELEKLQTSGEGRSDASSDDAFRIHLPIGNADAVADDGENSSMKKALAIANGKKAASLTLSSLAKAGHDVMLSVPQPHHFGHNFNLFFPPAVQFAKHRSAAFEESSPTLVLSPMLVETKSGSEVLQLFDDVLIRMRRAPFLSESSFHSFRASWDGVADIARWRCFWRNDGDLDNSETSLLELLITRLEYAVFEFFAKGMSISTDSVIDSRRCDQTDYLASKRLSTSSDDADGSSSDHWVTAPEDSSSDDRNADEYSVWPPVVHCKNIAPIDLVCDQGLEKATSEAAVKTIISTSRCHEKLSGPFLESSPSSLMESIRCTAYTLDEACRSDVLNVLSPFLQLLPDEGSQNSLQPKLSNLVLAPLEWFLRANACVDMKRINLAVEKSLERMIEQSDSYQFVASKSVLPGCKTIVDDVAGVRTDLVDVADSQPSTAPIDCPVGKTDSSVSAKKVKRKKKRKKRKSMNVDVETAATDVTCSRHFETKDQGVAETTASQNCDDDNRVVTAVCSSNQLRSDSSTNVDQPPPSVENELVATVSESTDAESDSIVGGDSDPHQPEADRLVVPGEKSDQDGTCKTPCFTDGEARAPVESLPIGDDDGSTWETVEFRSRKKTVDRSHSSSRSGFSSMNSHGSFIGGTNGSHSKKAKGARSTASRKRIKNVKMVRDILWSVLDIVDDEVKKRKKSVTKNIPTDNAATQATLPSPLQRGDAKNPMTLRDLVVGIDVESNQQVSSPLAVDRPSPALGDKAAFVEHAERISTDQPTPRNVKGDKKTSADQNTAPTVPETMSAVSANSMNTNGLFGTSSVRRSVETGIDQDMARSDSSCEELIETQKDLLMSCSTTDEKDSSPDPPLLTLLSPGNVDSASSSVASSLEVPHGHHHHRSYSACDNVGYHLLDVCERLTRDMNVFMDRRGLALNVRRRERDTLLVALQDTLSKLWPGRCSVNMYGSCATQLDLPSSDLDVVVCGLDRMGELRHGFSSQQKASSKKSGRRVNPGSSALELALGEARGESPVVYTHAPAGMFTYSPFSPFNPIQLQSINSERVLRLAAELERQPWAVHVKAVPTATVPVVKIIADPAKLPGAKATADSASDWISHHQQMAAQAAVVAGRSASAVPSSVSHTSLPHYHSLHAALPWRGADVMNGLLSVDITFEGPEHGGIGSTQLSSLIVKEACEEYACSPERAPLVQVLMVLKEMLAQRRLNEPFSGGLSSYALLLLVEALVKERGVIREELERVERQRRVVAAGGGNLNFVDHNLPKATTEKVSARRLNQRDLAPISAERPPSVASSVPKESEKGEYLPKVNQTLHAASAQSKNILDVARSDSTMKSGNQLSSGLKTAIPTSSWASVAKKNTSFTTASKVSTEQHLIDESVSVVQPAPAGQKNMVKPKVSTFADAVTRSFDADRPTSGVDQKRSACPDSSAVKNDASKARTTNVQSSLTKGPPDRIVEKRSEVVDEKPPIQSPSERTSMQSQPPQTRLNSSTVSFDSALVGAPQLFPQGSNDVVEVLCSGDTTAGKLLMHFLLFYGQHFDARATAIDVSGKHPDGSRTTIRPHLFSPYIQRRPGGTIDPVSGMLTVDPIVVYDPLEGAETNNVARSCFLWSNIRWVFAQSYNTLSSAVERSPTPPTTPGRQQQVLTSKASDALADEAKRRSEKRMSANDVPSWRTPYPRDDGQPPVDSPLLELLLSF